MRRIWCEHLDPQVAASDRVLGPLRARGIQLVLAVRPGQVEAGIRVLVAARRMGLAVAVWPMLGDEEGRWVNAANAHRFVSFVEHILGQLDAVDARPDELAIDLEPPIGQVRTLLRGDPRPLLDGWTRPPAQDSWTRLFAELARREIRPWAAVVPLVLADRPGRAGWQRLLSTHVDDHAFECVSPMVYTSVTGGYTRGLLRRSDLQALLYRACRASVLRFGRRAAVSLGAVAPGALGDETTYVSPEELQEDVAIARAAGIDDLALFDLTGVVQRGPIEAWLDAFVDTPPALRPPPQTLRARVVATLTVVVSRAAGG